MSYCRKEGKDLIIFATKENHEQPSSVTLGEPEQGPGLINQDGTINWNCPCLGGMATGPCGLEFREAFSCFHYSKEEVKGSDCFEEFRTMQNCMSKYPSVYGHHDLNENDRDDDDDDDFDLDDREPSGPNPSKPSGSEVQESKSNLEGKS